MAKSSTNVDSLIKTTFALQVAVRSSEDAELICRKNQLTFSELMKPFCALSNNGEFTREEMVVGIVRGRK